ncbi:MAG: VOC family protein [Rhodospirillales bacterium]
MSGTIIPTLRYRDAATMIDWLIRAFGFERHLVVEDGDGGIAHAQLTLGSGMVMLGSARDDSFGALQSTAQALGGVTQSAYIVVSTVDALCEQARAAGAEIVMEPKDEDYGGRGFSCRDPEGQLWNFGSYDPWRKGAGKG